MSITRVKVLDGGLFHGAEGVLTGGESSHGLRDEVQVDSSWITDEIRAEYADAQAFYGSEVELSPIDVIYVAPALYEIVESAAA